MFNYSRIYSLLVVSVIGSVIVMEVLTESIKKEEYYIMNREPDIPAEHSFPSLPYSGSMIVGTTSATISVDV